ncbi:hypothetical protein QBC41DRAFT_225906 [Cercophora samala]|uniref:Uncharacterized protein n=1 Tax=Cercophora samala TaxID=330535 RepID=A0AA39ZCW3_9PEZI|nr:hypothetical protein QBC41DRAFT_225906 [Cercophora samala]
MSSEDIGGIRVQRETVIVVEDSPHLRNRRDGSPATTINSNDLEEMDSQISQYSRPKTFRKLSNASSILTDIFRPDTDEDVLRRKIKRANDRDSSRDLIEFLRNTSPPPQNFMSIPDTFDSPPVPKKKRRPFWSFWKKRVKRGKKKDARLASGGVIRLPDTAVAGRTTGGHRHIAISIPVEYDHLDELTQEPTPPPSDDERAGPVTVLPPVVEEEKRESIESVASGTTTSSTSAKSEELFSMLPSPESPMERLSTDRVLSAAEPIAQGGTGSRTHSRPPSRMANNSVGAHSMITIPSPHELTPLPKGSISDFVPVDNTIVNTRPQTDASMEENRLERKPTKESFYTVMSDPRSPAAEHHPTMGTQHDSIAAHTSNMSLRRRTMAAIQDPLDAENSETEDIPSTRYCTPMSPHPLSFQSRVASIFPPLEPFSPLLPKPKPSCTFRITPIMTVVDVQPVSARQSPAPRLKEQRSLVSKKSIVFPLRTPEIHITGSDMPSYPHHHRPKVRHMPSFSDMRSKASVEHLILARHSSFVPTVSTRTSYSTLPTRPPTACSFRHSPPAAVPRSESHQNLIRQYEEIRYTHDHEIEVLVQRLDRLESVNNRWLNTVIPLIERLARRLPSSRSTLSTYKSTSDTSGDATPKVTTTSRKHYSYPQHRHNPYPQNSYSQPYHISSEVFTSDSDSLDHRHVSHSNPPIPAGYHSQYYEPPQRRNTSDASSCYWDPSNDDLLLHSYSQGGQEVAVDRLPSRHAGESLLGGDFGTMFTRRVREVESQRQQGSGLGKRERPLSGMSQLSGMESLEPVMRELVEETGAGEEGELRGLEDPVGGHR